MRTDSHMYFDVFHDKENSNYKTFKINAENYKRHTHLHSTSRSSLTLESSSRLLFPSKINKPGCTNSLTRWFSSSLLLSSGYCKKGNSTSSKGGSSLQTNKSVFFPFQKNQRANTKKLGELTNIYQWVHILQIIIYKYIQEGTHFTSTAEAAFHRLQSPRLGI